MELRAVLFDADGVLFDATELHKVTFNDALRPHGYTITDEEHDTVFNGLPTRVKLEVLTEMKGLPRSLHKQIEADKQERTLLTIPHTIKPTSGMAAALERLKANGVVLAICSNARWTSVYDMVEYAKLGGIFSIVLGNESVLRNKPFPDIYQLAAKQLDVPIENCVIVEDSPKGMVSGISAGPGKIIRVASPEDTVKKIQKLL